MSLAFDTSPVQTIKKVEETRKRKKNEQRSQALGKRRVKAKRGHGQDPWVASRKKMGKLRNNRKQNRRAKHEAAELPCDDIAATAAHDDPVSDAAPTTPLIKSRKATILIATPGEDMSRLDLPSPPAFASTPEDDIEPPTLETVTEVPESEPAEEAGDFTINYNVRGAALGRSHTTANAKKKLRRTKRGQQAQYKWAVSHTGKIGRAKSFSSKKDWKNRRRAARRIKTEDHYDMHLPSDAPSYQSARPKGKWVAKQPTPAKGDCSGVNKDNADARPAEAVPGRVETEVEAVEDKNIFNALSRKSPRNRGNRHFRRNPRWRRNRKKYQKKKAETDQPAAAEAPAPAAIVKMIPVKAAPEAKSANEAPATTKPAAPQRRPNRRRNRYRKKNNQNRKQEAAKSENKPDQESTAKPEGPAATDAVQTSGKRNNRRRNNRNRKGNGKPNAPEQSGQDGKQAPQQQGAKNAQRTNKPFRKNNKRFVWKAKKRGRSKNNAAAKDVYVPGPTAVDL